MAEDKTKWVTGQKVLVTKNEIRSKDHTTWVDMMDRFDGETLTIGAGCINKAYTIRGWWFHIDWLSAVPEEVGLVKYSVEYILDKLKLGEKVVVACNKEQAEILNRYIRYRMKNTNGRDTAFCAWYPKVEMATQTSGLFGIPKEAIPFDSIVFADRAEVENPPAEEEYIKSDLDGTFWRLATKDDVGSICFLTDRLRSNSESERNLKNDGKLILNADGSWSSNYHGSRWNYAYVLVEQQETVVDTPEKTATIDESAENNPEVVFTIGGKGWRQATRADDVGKVGITLRDYYTTYDILAIKERCKTPSKLNLAGSSMWRQTGEYYSHNYAFVPIDEIKEDDTIAENAANTQKVEEVKETMRGFEVGQMVLITKPKYTDVSPYWVEDMDRFNGKIGEIKSLYGDRFSINGCVFHKDWLTPLIESKGRYFRKATKGDIGKPCYFTDIVGLSDLQQSLLNRDTAPLGSFNSRGQAVKLLAQSPWTHAFVEVFDKEEDLTDKQLGAKIVPTEVKEEFTPAEKSAKTPKKESKMALLSFASKTVRNAAWSVVDWAIVTPTKNTCRPVVKITQYALCYTILATVAYSGWSLYQNPNWVFEKVTQLSPIEIRFKGDPANEAVVETPETTENN